MRFPQNKNQGFTLVEVMVALAAGTVIMILVLGAFGSLTTTLTTTECYRNMHNDIRHAMDVMQRDIARGSGVLDCIASNRLALTTQEASASTNFVSVVYTLTSNTLYRTQGSGAGDLLATDIESISFALYDLAGMAATTPADAYFVDVQIEAQTQAVLNTYEDEVRTRTRLRSKGL